MANVPRVPGVPNLTSYLAITPTLLVADLALLTLGFQRTIWGVFLDGAPVISFDSMVSFDYRQDNPVSDYPVEQGGFQSYDKVQLPAELRVTLSCGGSVARRQAFLQSIFANINTIDLYDVVTPERVYLDYNFTHLDFRRRSDQGNGLIVVDLWLTEIRQTSQTTFSDTQTPIAAGQQSTGNVQPQDVGGSGLISGVTGVQ